MTPEKCFTIGVAGGSGAGKTYLLKNLQTKFDSSKICVLAQDLYYRPRATQQKDENGIENFDLPDAIDEVAFLSDIRKLKAGMPVQKLSYTFNNAGVMPVTLHFHPAPLLIIEGLFVHYYPDIITEIDLKIYIDAPQDIRLSRRIKRDQEERGYRKDDVVYRNNHHVLPVHNRHIEPMKDAADVVIPNAAGIEETLDLLIAAIRARVKDL